MLPQTLEHFRAHQYTREGRINRLLLAGDCITFLHDNAIVTVEQEIDSRARIIADFRIALLGDAPSSEVAYEEEQIISPLLSGSHDGQVQSRLTDGYVLCAAQIERVVTNNGGDMTIRRRGRFITTNVDLIEHYSLEPEADALVRKATGLNRRWELFGKRQPQLAARRQVAVADIQQRIREELPEIPQQVTA
jgi:hypothetical protein